MAAGLPMVVTKVGGNSEAVDDGINGFLVPSRNPSKLAESLEILISSKTRRYRMGLASKEKADKYFSICLVVLIYENIYSTLFNK